MEGRKRTREDCTFQSQKRHQTEPAAVVAIPYFAPADSLPADLPETAAIESSPDVLYERTAAKVVSLGHHYVVKFGRNVSLEEGRTMQYVGERAGIPVPRVYALYSEVDKNYIVMERIHGETLQDKWSTLSEPEKTTIAVQIKRHLRDLRALPSPGRFCSLDNKPLRDSLLSADGTLECDRPFEEDMDFVDAVVNKYRASEALKGKAHLYATVLPSIFRDSSPVLTHGDLQRKNIMIRAGSQASMSIVFLDWECAGWYPPFWEFAQAMGACGFFEDDWDRWILKFTEPFWDEYAWIYILQREIGY